MSVEHGRVIVVPVPVLVLVESFRYLSVPSGTFSFFFYLSR